MAAACPDGLADQAELEQLTSTVLADAHAVALPATGQSPMSHADRYTSHSIVEAERTVTASATARLDQDAARVPAPVVEEAFAAFTAERGFPLSAEQEAVVRRLLTAGHGIEAVIGVAGSGKTTVMDAARRAWQAAGLTVKGASTAAVAAAKLRAEARIDSATLAAWQQRIACGDGLAGVDVLIVDEAAMVDDRALAVLVAEAERTGTKLVAIGDPQQLRAVGVGGAFARVHDLVGGLALAENRRQRDAVERSALRVWRDGHRATTLAVWGATGHVHATADLHDAYAQMVAAWWSDWSAHPDPHEGIEQALMLAATNTDVDQLNARARVIARTDGRLTGPDTAFALAGGDRLELAAGDVVRVRRNDYRDDVDVLNGYRGVVRTVDARRGALIEWRQNDARPSQAWISPDQLAQGHLVHGYALTIAAAQGLTSSTCHVLGLGADAHALYPAMSRVKARSDLYLPAAELEPEDVQLRLGQARTPREQLDRVLAAYARTLTDADEGMVTDALDGARRPAPIFPVPTLSPAQARAGQGPTMREAAPRIQALHEQAAAAELRAEQLHRELVELNVRAQHRRWGRRSAQQRLDQVHAGLDQARAQHRQALAEAQRLHEEAVTADVVIAQHSSRTVPAPPPADHPPADRSPARPSPAPSASSGNAPGVARPRPAPRP
ncbi:hypothetical protein ABH917_000035 [Thermobifida halotolerans]